MQGLINQSLDLLHNRMTEARYCVQEFRGKRSISPKLQFENRRVRVFEPAMAEWAVKDKRFEVSWGWYVDPPCLPEAVAETWSRLDRVARQTVLLRLIKGQPVEKALNGVQLLPVSQAETKPTKIKKIEGRDTWVCPGCGEDAHGKTKREALERHYRSAHPERPLAELLE